MERVLSPQELKERGWWTVKVTSPKGHEYFFELDPEIIEAGLGPTEVAAVFLRLAKQELQSAHSR